MNSVNVRDLRNHGADVLDRVAAGESIVILRSGSAVGELRPLPRKGVTAAELVRRRQHLPTVDPEKLRADLDTVLDSTL